MNYLSGHARLAGVMGFPIGHSLSPRLHGHWLQHYRIDGAYLPLAVHPEHLGQALSSLVPLGFRGCNLTIPHKVRALDMVDELDANARRIGAVNTIVVDSGRLIGSNTDGYGFIENLRAGCADWKADAGPAVLLGAGGAARAIAVALLDAGVPGLRLVNRTRRRAEELADILGPVVDIASWDERNAALADVALLVNTTSLGMVHQPPLDVSLDRLPATAIVTDIVYAPLQTDLLVAAGRRGNRTVDGLGMLLHQARPGFSAWFGRDPEVTDDLRGAVLAGIENR